MSNKPEDANKRRPIPWVSRMVSEGDGVVQSNIEKTIEGITSDLNASLVTIVTGKYQNTKSGNLKTKMNQKNIIYSLYESAIASVRVLTYTSALVKTISDKLLDQNTDDFKNLFQYPSQENESKINGTLTLDLTNPEAIEYWDKFIKTFDDTEQVNKYISNINDIGILFYTLKDTFSPSSDAVQSIENLIDFCDLNDAASEKVGYIKLTLDSFEKLSKTKLDYNTVSENIQNIQLLLTGTDGSLTSLSSVLNSMDLDSIFDSFDKVNKAILGISSKIDTKSLDKVYKAYLSSFAQMKKLFDYILTNITKEDIEELKNRLEQIKELFDNTLPSLITSASKNDKAIEDLKNSFASTYKIATDAADFDKKKLAASKASLGEIISAVALMSVVMMIGAVIVENYPNLIPNSLLFGATLSLFLLELIPSIAILSILNFTSTKDSMKGLTNFIIASSIVMLLGAYIVEEQSIRDNALKFGIVLGAFITLMITPIALLAVLDEGGKVSNALKFFKGFIITASIIMILGAYFIEADNGTFWKNALKFGIIFSAFLALTLLPIIGFSSIMKTSEIILGQVTGFVIASSLVLMIGAAVMNNDGMVRAALSFGLVFSAFIALTLLPILGFAYLVPNASKTIDELADLIISTAAVMLIGAYIIKNREIVTNSLLFGVVLCAFLTLVLTPVLIFSRLMKKATVVLETVAGFIVASAAIMMFGAYIILKKPDLVTASLVYGVILAAFVFLVLLPFLMLNKKDMTKSVEGLIFVGAFILASSIALFIAAFTYNKYGKDAIKGAVLLGVFVIVMGLVMKLITNSMSASKEAAVSMAIMAFVLIEIALAIYIINEVVPEIDQELLLKLALVGGVIVAMGLIVWLLSKWINPKDLVMGAASLAAMAGVLMLFGLSIGLINTIIKDEDVTGDLTESPLVRKLAVVGLCLIGMGVALFLASLMGTNALIGAAALGLTVGVFGLLTYVLGIIDNLIDSNDLWAIPTKVGILALILTGITGLFAIVGIPAVAALVAIGAAVIAAMAGAIYLVAKSIESMINLVKLAEGVGDVDAIKTVFDKFIDVIDSISLGPIKLVKLLIKAAKIGIIASALAGPLSRIARTVSDLANLKVATDWDPKTGRPTKYRQLNESDFKLAATSIYDIVTTLAKGIFKASKYFENIDMKTLFKTLLVTRNIGKVIGSISEGLQSYAQLLIPNRWNSEGKPVHFVRMEQKDFEEATSNIKKIIITMADAVSSVYTGRESLFDEAMEVSSTGIFGTKFSAQPSPFTKVLTASALIGQVISGISEGLQSYANLLVPTAWNKDGRPIKFRKISNTEITQAQENISSIITALATAISGIYNSNPELFNEEIFMSKDGGWFSSDEYSSKPSPFMRVLSASAILGNVLNGIATGIQAFANLNIPTDWDPQTGKPTKFRRMEMSEFPTAASNISSIITLMAQAVKDAYYGENGFIKILEPEKFKEVTESFVPLGSLISSLADGISKMALLMIPDEWDEKTGKAKHYRQMVEGDFINAGNNIDKIINSLATSVLAAYDKYKENLSTHKFKAVCESFVPLGELMKTIADSIAMYATGTFKGSDGKVVKLTHEQMVSASSNMVELLTTSFNAIVTFFDSYSADRASSLFGSGPDSITNMIIKMSEVSDLLDQVAEMVNNASKVKDASRIGTILTSVLKAISDVHDVESYRAIIESDIVEKILKACTSAFTLVDSNIEFMSKFGNYDNKKLENAKKNISTMLSSIINIVAEDDSTLQAKIDNLTIFSQKVKTFSEIVRDLMGISLNVSTIDITPLTPVSDAISKFAQDSENFNPEPLSKFVKAVNTIDMKKASTLTKLMESMSKLASKMGGFDKLAEALDEDFVNVLKTLSEKVDTAKRSIEAAERIEKERQAKLEANIEKISKLMKESISIKVGSLDEDDTINAGYETEK